MRFSDRQPAKIALLAIAAGLLGIAVVEVDAERRGGVAVAAGYVPSAAQAQLDPVARATSSPGQLVADARGATPQPPVSSASAREVVDTRGGVSCTEPHRVVRVDSSTVIRSKPGGGAMGTLPATSRYLGQSTVAWVQAVSPDGRWGRVTVPWAKPVGQPGWILLEGLRGGSTQTMVVADLSDRRLRAYRGCEELFSVGTAIGRPGSPSPTGRFWVTDRIAVPGAQQGSFGTYAFGLSTVQPNLPAGWTGGDQMAIHGTGAPGTIGQAASAGCLRVDEPALARLRPLLRVGTPVVIQA